MERTNKFPSFFICKRDIFWGTFNGFTKHFHIAIPNRIGRPKNQRVGEQNMYVEVKIVWIYQRVNEHVKNGI